MLRSPEVKSPIFVGETTQPDQLRLVELFVRDCETRVVLTTKSGQLKNKHVFIVFTLSLRVSLQTSAIVLPVYVDLGISASERKREL